MKLSPEDQLAAAQLAAKARPCRLCGSANIEITNRTFALIDFKIEEPIAAPVLVAHCQDCAHVTLFSATALGMAQKIQGVSAN